MTTETTPEARRPLKVRDARWTKQFAAWLSQRSITPNMISIGSVGFAFLAGSCLLTLHFTSQSHTLAFVVLPLLAALFIQLRLLCNLFDGMVAMEGGKSTPSGELFNDIPDRVADPLILVAAGYALSGEWGPILGWLAALLAVLTAYVRTLAASIGAPVNFAGPMAKQHRMAIMTGACVFAAAEVLFIGSQYSLFVALCVINLGCLATLYNRTRAAYNYLEKNT